MYDDEKGIYVSKDGKESYNFPVIQADSNEKIENITFNKNNQNEYDVYLVKYDYTKEDLQNFSREELAQRDQEYFPLIKEGIVYNEYARWMICIEIRVLKMVPINEGNLTGDFGYEAVWVTTSTQCESEGEVGPSTGGGGSGGSGSGSSGGGGAGGGSTGGSTGTGGGSSSQNAGSDSILSAAVADVDNSNQTNNPCQDLKSNTVNLQFRQKLNTLNKPFYFNKDHETAFIETKNGNVKGFTFLESPSGENNHINIKDVLNPVSYMHVHTNDYTTIDSNGETIPVYTAKIPSGADLNNFFWLQLKAYQQGVPPAQTYGLAISSEAIYTFKLKINDYMAVTTALNDLQNNYGFDWEVFKDNLDKETKKILKKNLPAPEEKAKTEKLLLKSLKDSHLDQLVGLYEGTSMGSDLYADVSWKEKYLYENNNLQSKPCN